MTTTTTTTTLFLVAIKKATKLTFAVSPAPTARERQRGGHARREPPSRGRTTRRRASFVYSNGNPPKAMPPGKPFCREKRVPPPPRETETDEARLRRRRRRSVFERRPEEKGGLANRREMVAGIAGALCAATKTEDAKAEYLANKRGKQHGVGNEEKRENASIEEVKEILERDLQPVEKQTDGTFTGAYFVTGRLTPEIFEDDCQFVDPTNTTKSLSKYVNTLKILFDPETSSVDLKSIEVKDDHTIVGVYDCEGYLKLPWHPRVKPYTGTVTWKTNENGLILSQTQVWSGVTAAGAIIESFTPS